MHTEQLVLSTVRVIDIHFHLPISAKSSLWMPRPVIVVMGTEEKSEMESEIQHYLPYKDRFSKIVVRSGIGYVEEDLRRCDSR